MLLTLKVSDDKYVDVEVDLQNKHLMFYSPIPDITREDLIKLVDTFGFKIILPITEEVVEPDDDSNVQYEYKGDLVDRLSVLLALCSFTISDC